MFQLVNLEGGELGRADGVTRIEHLPYLVKRIGQILVDVKPLLIQKTLTPIYCFEIQREYKQTLQVIINDIERDGLPRGCEFYNTDNTKVFDLRGPSGGLITSVCCYLIVK